MRPWLRRDGLTGLALPMLVWALHFLVVYVLAGLACARGWNTGSMAGISLLTWLLLGLSAVSLSLLALMARGAVRAAPAPDISGSADAAPLRRSFFVARATLALCALSAVAVIFTTLPMFFLAVCE